MAFLRGKRTYPYRNIYTFDNNELIIFILEVIMTHNSLFSGIWYAFANEIIVTEVARTSQPSKLRHSLSPIMDAVSMALFFLHCPVIGGAGPGRLLGSVTPMMGTVLYLVL